MQQLSAPVRTRQPYLAGLDNLRGAAALAVCLFHLLAGALPARTLVPAVAAVARHGHLGVPVFFVVSGFIVPYSLAHYRGVRQFGQFLGRRLLRLGPPAWAAMLLVVAEWLTEQALTGHAPAGLTQLGAGQVLHNMLFTAPLAGYDGLLSVGWTLAVELQFYVLLGLLYPQLFGRRRPLGWFVGVFAALGLLAAAAGPLAARVGLLAQSPLFALGGLALLWQRGQLPRWAWLSGLAGFTALGLWLQGEGVTLAGLLAVLALVWPPRPLPGLRWLGRISYSLYLTHVPVGIAAEYGLHRLLHPDTAAGQLLVGLACVAAAVAGAAAFHRWVEQPCRVLAQTIFTARRTIRQ